MKIIGSKFFGHDSAICVIDTKKEEIFAISTERVTRIKHDSLNIEPILSEYEGIVRDSKYFAYGFSDFGDKEKFFYDLSLHNYYGDRLEVLVREILKPKYLKDLKIAKKDKILKIFKKTRYNIFIILKILYLYLMMKITYKLKPFFKKDINKFFIKKYIHEKLKKHNLNCEIDYYDHHLCHAIGSYYMSNFDFKDEVLCLTIDGAGDGYFSKLFYAKDKKLNLVGYGKLIDFIENNTRYTTSIGFLYNKFTSAMDLIPGSDEGKVEALAAYGKADVNYYNELMESTIINNLNIGFDVNKIKKYFNIDFLKKIRNEIGDENFCATIQTYLEDIMVKYLNNISNKYPNIDKLCLSGGVAANIIMSLNIFERTNFKKIYVFPPMADDGVSIGAAIIKAIELGENIDWLKNKQMPYFGPKISNSNILQALEEFSGLIEYKRLGDDWIYEAAQSIGNNNIIAIVHGNMEFGPRALGNRSIIANPLDKTVKDKINSTVKRRPWYQPFCPSIIEEERERLFEDSFHHKHMAIAFRMKEKYAKKLPGAVHIDGTARPQFVTKEDNLFFYKLLKEVKKITGYGVVINTSFNLHGRTIVRKAEDAIVDFLDCNIDELYLEGYKIKKKLYETYEN